MKIGARESELSCSAEGSLLGNNLMMLWLVSSYAG